MTPGATDRRDLWCILLLLAIATVFFSDVLFAGSNFYYRDLFICVGARGHTDAPGRVLGVVERANIATIDIECTNTALLIATVTRHKYWRATIDGRPAQLVPVNLAYQGVLVPAGKHRIEMRYRNPVVMWSGIVSALTTRGVLRRDRYCSDTTTPSPSKRILNPL
jgi:hypothetical protein